MLDPLLKCASCIPWISGKDDEEFMEEIEDIPVPRPTSKEMPPSGQISLEKKSSVVSIPIVNSGVSLDQHRPSFPSSSTFDELVAASLTNASRSPMDKKIWKLKALRGMFSVVEPSAVEEAMKKVTRHHIVEQSMNILRSNDLGGYTVPARGLYPFQWNWDSAIVAAGWAVFDEPRAWEELETLFSGQWDDGMVPSIIFHKESDTYFPGPEIWGTTERPSKSTGISQPPVAAMSARFLFEHAHHVELAQEMIASLFPKLMEYHRWWYKARDPNDTGLVAILHPWESGMDNSPAWDAAMQFPIGDFPPYKRRDLTHVDADMRPTKDTYDHYLTLLYLFKNTNNYDWRKLYHISPFRVTDLCVNSILFRANRDLLWIAEELGMKREASEIKRWINRGLDAMDSLWDEKAGIFKCKDQITGKLLDAPISAGFLPLFAGVASKTQARRLASVLDRWLSKVKRGVPSMDPDDPRFEPLRYWRGPVWIIINWMISNGLKHYGYLELAERVKKDSIALTDEAGLLEYFNPITGDGAGGRDFSWTASMCLSWLDRPAAIAIGNKLGGSTKHLSKKSILSLSNI